MSTSAVFLGLILLALIFIGRDIAAIRSMMVRARMCPQCHGTGRVPEERDLGGEECGACKGTGERD